MHKFSFMCQTCNEQFNVDFEYMLKKDSLVCPNCSNTLPDDVFKHLITITKSIEEYEASGMNNHRENPNHFAMTIH